MASRQALAPKLYKRFLQVCEQWPVDQNRLGRDLGEHLKGNLVPRIKNSQIDPKEAEKMLDSLLKISSNYYRNKYPRQKETAFTTNSVQDCQEAASYYLSSDFQKKSKQQSWWEKLIRKKPTAS
ncbi:ubiquinol-cytochrome-c reductase complex assembly factor 2-like [Stylophora pistillata]|uniref:Mitochondrial nucleoid factor 1 n=1 Tax=Stylophora pistillata TaxID=50429 RepID=A0A2B4RKH7_STYPI|nr:ubiquinol-cytochrome-c reductase complex assembly factor 2-like [Stylophora pistillata]PFX16765.1 Ubiquinol-cytochrome-c reductase complex assembly factor 2 [Stylophora pistillata]